METLIVLMFLWWFLNR